MQNKNAEVRDKNTHFVGCIKMHWCAWWPMCEIKYLLCGGAGASNFLRPRDGNILCYAHVLCFLLLLFPIFFVDKFGYI